MSAPGASNGRPASTDEAPARRERPLAGRVASRGHTVASPRPFLYVRHLQPPDGARRDSAHCKLAVVIDLTVGLAVVRGLIVREHQGPQGRFDVFRALLCQLSVTVRGEWD